MYIGFWPSVCAAAPICQSVSKSVSQLVGFRGTRPPTLRYFSVILPCSLFVICLTTPTSDNRVSVSKWVKLGQFGPYYEPYRPIVDIFGLGWKLVKFLVKSRQSGWASSPMSTIVWVLVKNLSSWALVIMSGSSLERLLLTHLWPFCHRRRRSRRCSAGSTHRPS